MAAFLPVSSQWLHLKVHLTEHPNTISHLLHLPIFSFFRSLIVFCPQGESEGPQVEGWHHNSTAATANRIDGLTAREKFVVPVLLSWILFPHCIFESPQCCHAPESSVFTECYGHGLTTDELVLFLYTGVQKQNKLTSHDWPPDIIILSVLWQPFLSFKVPLQWVSV